MNKEIKEIHGIREINVINSSLEEDKDNKAEGVLVTVTVMVMKLNLTSFTVPNKWNHDRFERQMKDNNSPNNNVPKSNVS